NPGAGSLQERGDAEPVATGPTSSTHARAAGGRRNPEEIVARRREPVSSGQRGRSAWAPSPTRHSRPQGTLLLLAQLIAAGDAERVKSESGTRSTSFFPFYLA
ncbi:hypothetical protein, partial [Paenibacillus sp. HGF7]|uniref:hypothetical protein n=2 Tax=unclassified Paenibacillus TaxID=185978 RepID=UPI001BABE970